MFVDNLKNNGDYNDLVYHFYPNGDCPRSLHWGNRESRLFTFICLNNKANVHCAPTNCMYNIVLRAWHDPGLVKTKFFWCLGLHMKGCSRCWVKSHSFDLKILVSHDPRGNVWYGWIQWEQRKEIEVSRNLSNELKATFVNNSIVCPVLMMVCVNYLVRWWWDKVWTLTQTETRF